MVSHREYPSEALNDGAEGTVFYRLDVGADGGVDRCTIVASAGHPALDRATCRLSAPLRFDPAIGPDGKRIAAPVFLRTVWAIQD
jgi:protein TonB